MDTDHHHDAGPDAVTELARDDRFAAAAGLTSFRRYTVWSLLGGIPAFLAVPFVYTLLRLADGPDPIAVVAVVALLAVAGICGWLVTCLVPLRDRTPEEASRRFQPGPLEVDADGQRQVPWTMIAVAAVAAGLVGGLQFGEYGDDYYWAIAPALVLALTAGFLPRRKRRVVLALGALTAAGITLLVLGTRADALVAAVWSVGVVLFVAAVKLAQLWTWEVATRLDDARHVAGELAVADERLRFAADLHDIQGHHLQVIALKSELAARIADRDPQAAAEQMREVQQLATDAMQDTRAVIQGYRRTSLDAEVANATRVLAAANIDGRMLIDPALDAGSLSDASRQLLGLTVREATTNVLRHSEARRADLDLRLHDGCVQLEVRNDGARAPRRNGEPGAGQVSSGTGLATLASRLTEVGGTLTWRQDDDRFEVRAIVPFDPQEDARS